MKKVLSVLSYVFFIVGFCIFFYGVWSLERQVNYKYSYQLQVEQSIQPLKQRLDILEKRIIELEKNEIAENN
jgi:hypothetical protein